jgi:hypothetical protein
MIVLRWEPHPARFVTFLLTPLREQDEVALWQGALFSSIAVEQHNTLKPNALPKSPLMRLINGAAVAGPVKGVPMLNTSLKSTAVALLSVAVLATATLPASANSARYCRENIRVSEGHGGFNPILLLPLAAVGAGAGAVVGAAVGGLSVGTGAAIGAGTGAGFGVLHGTAHYKGKRYDDYADAYERCRRD